MSRFTARSCRSAFAAALVAAVALAQAPINNDCSIAYTVYDGVNPSPPQGVSGGLYTNVNATNSAAFGVECVAATHFNKDVFYSYTASFSGPITVSTCTPSGFAPGTLLDTVVAVYSNASCPGGAAALACDDDDCAQLSTLTFTAVQSATYLIRVGSWSTSASGTFYLTIAPQMPNDFCGGALPLAVGTIFSPGYTLGSTYDMSFNAGVPGCGPVASADVWYTYTAPTNQHLWVSSTGVGAAALALFHGDCPGLGQVPNACDGVAGPLSVDLIVLQGATVKLRVNAGAAIDQGLFTLTAHANDVPVGEVCSGPITVFDGLNPAVGTFSMFGMTELGETPVPVADCGPAGALNRSMWFRYVATCDGPMEASTCTAQAVAAGALDKARVWVYADACGGTPISGCPIDDCVTPGRTRALFVAQQGSAYRIRVSVPSGALNPAGEFDLKISSANATCATAHAIQVGSTDAATSVSPTGKLYYSITPASNCMVQLILVSAPGENAFAAAPTCGTLVTTPNQTSQIVFYAYAGTTHVIRVEKTGPGLGVFSLLYGCLGSPVNDEPAGALEIFDGVNPIPPNGTDADVFHNVGATDTAGMSECFSLANDVFFTYQAGVLERVKISLCPVAGLSLPSLADPVMQVIKGAADGTVIACSDDVCGYYPSVTFVANPFLPGPYTIRIGEWFGGYGGTFRIVVEKQLSLIMTKPNGTGSIKIENKFGKPFAGYFTVLTLNAGEYPDGPFFGIEPSGVEIILQAQSNIAPFLGALDATGASTYGPVAGLPPLVVYGVTLALNPFGYLDEISGPAMVSIF
jgi:hypothetical protein